MSKAARIADKEAARIRVVRIVEQYIRAKGFDGLYNPMGECACLLKDLGPCLPNDGFCDCEPGYLAPCPKSCGDHDWHIVPVKPKRKGGGK